LSEARRHFHLDLNGMLDRAEAAAKVARTRAQRLALSKLLRQIWVRAQRYEGAGEFDKVLKRLYRLAGIARLRFLRRRAHRDVLASPDLAARICDYIRSSGTVLEYLRWLDMLMQHPEQIYPDVNVTLIDSLLRLEAGGWESRRIRTLAASFLSGNATLPGAAECRALAPLLILRFGDRRSLPLLRRCFDDEKSPVSAPVLRAAALVYSSYGDREFAQVRRSASRLLRNHLADVVRLIERLRRSREIPVRYVARLQLRYDSVAQIRYVDMRTLLTVRLLHLARAPVVTRWVSTWKVNALSAAITPYDRRLVNRLI
jgi:hypothetical protein